MTVSLIGYRGSGKSSVAAPLAQRLGWDWVDADAVIEERAGSSIREIFAEFGEPHFRELERQVMADLLRRERLVIAAGGGAILNADTRNLLRSAGPVIWLRASVATLEARILGDATTAERRPALTNYGAREEITRIVAEREPLYRECATCILDTDVLDVAEIVARIEDHLAGGKDGAPKPRTSL